MGWRELVGVILLFGVYVGLAAWLPPLDDELYYWCWAKELQWSYYDHPAMTAVLIRASTEVFGDTLLAIRLPACAAMAGVFALLLSVTRPKSMLLYALVTPPFTFGAVLITPDTPLLFFWAAYLRWLIAVHVSLVPPSPGGRRVMGEGESGANPLPPNPPPARGGGELRMWLLGGALLGCGVLGKYTMGLAGVCGFVSFALLGRSNVRKWLGGYIVHGVAAVAVASPILIHNLKHDFVPLLYQWGHAMADDEPGLRPLAEFAGVQVLLVGTLPLVLLPWVFRHWRELTADPRLRVCVCLFALPSAFFLAKATRGPLEGNWALASYLGFWPLAGVWWKSCGTSVAWRWLTRAAFLIPAVMVALTAVHMVAPLPFVPIKDDRIYRAIEKDEEHRLLKEFLDTLPERGPVFVPTYQLTAALRFHGIDARQYDGVTRPSHFTQVPDDAGRHPVWYYFGDFPLPEQYAPRSVSPRARVVDIPLTVRGEWLATHTLWVYRSAP